MKRVVVAFVIFVAALGLVACGKTSSSSTNAGSGADTGVESNGRPVNHTSGKSKSDQSKSQNHKSETKPAGPTEPSKTASQENALQAAESYLETSAFSKSGLEQQLKFEGFSAVDAKYAATSVGANWNEQAAKSAKSYLETSSFSESGLVQQLEFEGFTSSEAQYGVSKSYPGRDQSATPKPTEPGGSSSSASQENALRAAESYLETAAFSKSGLEQQLKFEGFSSADAKYAATSVGANWNEQAAKSAKSYLETSSFSESGLVQQLEFEGFTSPQAEYGVSKSYR